MASKKSVKAPVPKGNDHQHHGRDHDHGHIDKMQDLTEQELEFLYTWVDSIPLSRPKKNISRDFSDGVLVAEVLKHFFPHDVELHNYSPCMADNAKMKNWYFLNRKVFSKMNFELGEDVIHDLCCCKQNTIEKVLLMLQVKITRAQYAKGRESDKPEADQHQSLSPGRKHTDRKGMQAKGNKMEHLPQRKSKHFMETDTVPRIILEEREQEVLAKDEMVKMLQKKIQKMEHLLELKDMRIADLSEHVQYSTRNMHQFNSTQRKYSVQQPNPYYPS